MSFNKKNMHRLLSVDYFLLNSNAVPRSVSDINLSIMTFRKKNKTNGENAVSHDEMSFPQLRLIYYPALDQDSIKVFSMNPSLTLSLTNVCS